MTASGVVWRPVAPRDPVGGEGPQPTTVVVGHRCAVRFDSGYKLETVLLCAPASSTWTPASRTEQRVVLMRAASTGSSGALRVIRGFFVPDLRCLGGAFGVECAGAGKSVRLVRRSGLGHAAAPVGWYSRSSWWSVAGRAGRDHAYRDGW